MMRVRVRLLARIFFIATSLVVVWFFVRKQRSLTISTPSPAKDESNIPSPMTDILDSNTFEQRFLATFPSIYLTIISIIQGVAVYTLTSETNSYITRVYPSTFLIWKVPYWMQYIPFSLTSFLLIVILAFEYTWFVALFRWSPRLRDITIPLGLGFFETLPMYYFTNHLGYCLTTALVCLTGTYAYWHSWRFFPIVDIDDRYRKAVHDHLDQYFSTSITLALVAGLSLVALFISLSQNLFNVALLKWHFLGLLYISNYLQEAR